MSGAFSKTTKNDTVVWHANSGTGINGTVTFDASRSNSIYGASDTVQPPAITLIPQIKY